MAKRADSVLSKNTISTDIKSANVRNYYLLHGDEDFTRDLAADELISFLTPEQAPDFNVDRFYADDLNIEAITQAYYSYPMMTDRRVIVLRRCEKLSSGQCKELELLIDDPAPSSVVVAVGAKIDMRRRFFARLSKVGLAVGFRVPYENQVRPWLLEFAKAQGIELDPEAADLLVFLNGANLRELASELYKIAVTDKEIKRKHVEKFVSRWRETSIFELADQIGNRNLVRANRLLRRFLQDGSEALFALAMIQRHFQLMLKAKELSAREGSQAQLASDLGISPYFAGKYVEQVRDFTREQLWNGLSAMRLADRQLKTMGRHAEGGILDMLILQLCVPNRRELG